MRKYKFTRRWSENTDTWCAMWGLFVHLEVHIRPRMASHSVSWVLGAHVRFRNLDFIITMQGELAQVPAAVQPLHSAGLDMIVKALEELQLHAPEAHAPGSD